MENPATPPPARLHWSALTDRGRFRANNEDAFLALAFDGHEVRYLGKTGQASLAGADYVFAVSDGMGGAKSGEFASRIAVDRITRLLPRAFRMSAAGLASGFNDVLTELFLSIHADLLKLGSSYDECSGMGATLSLGWFTPEWMYFSHVGDSRIYHLPKGENEIKQLTDDDTHVGWLFRTGQINEREARTHPRRNVLQKALGGSNQFVGPQVGAVACQRGDFFLLCSDGLSEGLYDHYLVDILRAAAKDDKINPAQLLVSESVKNDGRDNTTALVVQVV